MHDALARQMLGLRPPRRPPTLERGNVGLLRLGPLGCHLGGPVMLGRMPLEIGKFELKVVQPRCTF